MTFEELKKWCRIRGFNYKIPWDPALFNTKTGDSILYIGGKSARLISKQQAEDAEFEDMINEEEHINNGDEENRGETSE